jgi:hypothetical protein
VTVLMLRYFFSATLIQGLAWGIVPVTVLGERAESIVVGSVASTAVTKTAAGEFRVQFRLQPAMALKGVMPAGTLTVELSPSALMKQHAEQYAAAGQVDFETDAYGMWFLQEKAGGNPAVLALDQGEYTENAAFLPLPRGWVPRAGRNIEQQLLSAVVASYLARRKPTGIDEGTLFVSLETADRQEAFAVVAELTSSAAVRDRIVGLAAAIRMGSDSALSLLAEDIDTLRSHEMFDRITRALQTYYKPSGPASIPALRRLAEIPADVPGLDLAVAKALQKLESRDVLPAMLRMLDSPDALAVRSAAWYFHFYAALAGPNGEINRTGDGQHPFRSAETARYGGRDSTITGGEHARFWKGWWQENRVRLGFPAEDR